LVRQFLGYVIPDKKALQLKLADMATRVEAARLLMEAGADVNAQDAIRDSPFLLAGARGHTEIVRLADRACARLRARKLSGGCVTVKIRRGDKEPSKEQSNEG
jgi:alkylation response protein AidB-like acyl-CoA dehydrogenase